MILTAFFAALVFWIVITISAAIRWLWRKMT
jgi:hypothetical protein